MASLADTERDLDVELHAMLLRLAGRVPDDLLVLCREWALAGRYADLAMTVTFAVLSGELRLLAEDRWLLDDLLDEADADTDVLNAIDVAEDETPVVHRFVPTADLASVAEFDLGEVLLQQAGATMEDGVDEAAVAATAAIAAESGIRGLWRSWRRPGLPVPWPPPRRVYVVEVDMDAEFLSIAARIQEALAAAGEAHPQVEVVPTSVELPVYQSAARAYGALLWARDPERELRLAKPFGGVGEEGDPSFDPDHPRIHDPVERNLVLRYLELGEPILFANAMTKDIVKPDRGEVVPFDVRTDGTWIWFDATAYYLSRHQLAPPADFLDHIRSAEYLAPVADGVAWHRAVAHLVKLQPGELPTEPVIEPVAEDETEPVIDEPVIDQEPAAEEPEPAPAAVVQAPPLNPIAAALMPNPIAAILEQDPMSEAAAPPAEAEGEPATPVFSDADIPEIAALKNITTLKVTAGGPATPVL